jgi:hypothetical protein
VARPTSNVEVAPRSRPAPREWGMSGEALHSDESCSSCPTASSNGGVVVLVVTDRPTTMFCSFLRSALWAGLDVTVLGWEPTSPPRWQVSIYDEHDVC